ncbi:hypothetical protein [Rhizobium tubonense]|uniref:hypothetical protein n=1 Tax=Rhizobium tubonense TaxID=484088 RepID=UPI001FCEB37D|nr:hypothetical protein [Rhizobium tubonense]
MTKRKRRFASLKAIDARVRPPADAIMMTVSKPASAWQTVDETSQATSSPSAARIIVWEDGSGHSKNSSDIELRKGARAPKSSSAAGFLKRIKPSSFVHKTAKEQAFRKLNASIPLKSTISTSRVPPKTPAAEGGIGLSGKDWQKK